MEHALKVPVRDAEIASLASGRADAPCLLLSNSLGATMEMWNPQMAQLEQNFRVIRYDTRGHGASATPPAPYTFDDLVADACAVLDAHDVKTASVMGLSLGGMTGLGLGLDVPDRIDRVVCCAARADAPQSFRDSWDQRIALLQAQGMEPLWQGTVEKWLTAETRQNKPEVVSQLRDNYLRTTAEGYRGCALALKELDYLSRLGDLKAPTLFVAGTQDMGAPVAVMQEMAQATPNAQFTAIADAAHIINLDNPTAFNAAIATFLA